MRPVINVSIKLSYNYDSAPLYVAEKKNVAERKTMQMQSTFSDKDSFGPLLQEAEVSA